MVERGLKQPAGMGVIHSFYRDGLLDDEMFTVAQSLVQPKDQWFDWVKRNLMFWVCALILSGIIFFFAYNWAGMGKFLKFGVIEAAIVLCVIGTHVSGIDRLSGKMFLLSAAVLVGVLLAVYGQTYQTGADAFELFTGWALLILGWVLVSEFAGLWMIWLVLLNTAALLYWFQVGKHTVDMSYNHLCLMLFAINGVALGLGEWGAVMGITWLRGRWHRIVLLMACLAALSVPTFLLIVDSYGSDSSQLTAGAWVLSVVGFYGWYRHKNPDMASLTLLAMDVCFIVLSLIGKILFEGSSGEGVFLVYALMILGVVSGAVFWLRKTSETIFNENRGGSL